MKLDEGPPRFSPEFAALLRKRRDDLKANKLTVRFDTDSGGYNVDRKNPHTGVSVELMRRGGTNKSRFGFNMSSEAVEQRNIEWRNNSFGLT